MQKIKDVFNGEGKKEENKRVTALIYLTIGVSMLSNVIVTLWHQPFSHLFHPGHSLLNILLDVGFISGFLLSNTFVLVLCTDLCLTRISYYQHPKKQPSERMTVGGMSKAYKPLAICYLMTCILGLASMLFLGMYRRVFMGMELSLGVRAAIYGVAMASVTMMLLGGVVMTGCALTVHKWKGSIKRCSSICTFNSSSSTSSVDNSSGSSKTQMNA